jgi:hypothetical protein
MTGRIQQQNPNNYRSSSQIHADFENIIRYLVSSERGSKSVPELMSILFDSDGNLDVNVELRFNETGLQYRTGDNDWETLVVAADLRGDPGRDIGDVALPIITQRTEYTATAAQTEFAYVHSASDVLFVHQNGILLSPDDYTTSPVGGTVTLDAGATVDDIISIYKVRGGAGITTTRTDTTVVAASQSVFSVTFPTDAYQEQVYLNGVLLAETTDYTLSTGTNTITLTEAAVTDDVFTAIFLSSSDSTAVTGFLLEGIYTDADTGLIPYSKLSFADGDLPVAKVATLADFLATAASIEVGSSTPVSPATGLLWLDTSTSPANLKIYDGIQFLSVQPTNTLPSIKTSDANYIVSINSSGTGFLYKALDFSALVYRTERAAAGGVATLDGDGLLEETQRPIVRVTDSIGKQIDGSVTDDTYRVKRLYGEKFRIIGHSAKTSSGTCSYQLSVSGVAVGSVYAASSSANDTALVTVIEVDALTLSKTLDVVITSAASAADFEIAISVERLN